MDDHETRAWKLIHQSAVTATISAVSLRLSVSLIAMVLLLWAAWGGFKLATDSDRYKIHADWAFCLGILTMLFGFLFLILGLPIVTDLFLNLSEQLQEEAGIQKGLNRMNDLGARETKTITQVTARIFGTLVTMLMLWWTIYTGFKLTTEPKHSKYYILTTSIGVIAIIFGMIYFTIGLAIIAELGLDLSSHYQRAKHNKNQPPPLVKIEKIKETPFCIFLQKIKKLTSCTQIEQSKQNNS